MNVANPARPQKESLPPADLAPAQYQAGSQQKGKPDCREDVRKQGVGGALGTIFRFPRAGILVRSRRRAP